MDTFHFHRIVLVRTSLLCCLCIQSFPLPSERREERGEKLTVTALDMRQTMHTSAYNIKWANAAAEASRVHNVSIKQQLQQSECY